MFAKDIKLAEKLIKKKQAHDGIVLLVRTLIKLNNKETYSKKEYQEAGRLFATVIAVKSNRLILAEFVKQVSENGVIFLLNIAVEFGQLKGAISAIEEWYNLKDMGLEMLDYYLDILDSFMAREKALSVAHDYLELHPELVLGKVSAAQILETWQKVSPLQVEATTAHEESDLELFALVFKIIKILYTEGRLAEAGAIIETVSPTVKSNPDIQDSKIKNGYNYFQYIAKLLPLKKNPHEDENNIIYMVGDSHCLSPAWAPVQLNNISYQVKPLLVTGCKIWHLREAAMFHAKTNFYKAIELIPAGGTVIFVFGEIDCREGILSALRKGEYTSPKKAIELLIDIYIKRIMETIKARSLTHIYIHQIPPVLEATRGIVVEFNQLLEQRIKSLKNSKISWLGFKGGLLADDGEFNSEFHFDETHLDPAYIHTAVLDTLS